MGKVGDMLREALDRKGWSILKAEKEIDAKEIGVNRFFLGRLVKGDRPPKLRRGSRSSTPPDERYRRVAVGLGLDVEGFLDAVERAQAVKPSRGPRKTEETARRSEGLRLPGDVRSRYPELAKVVDPARPLAGEDEIRDLANRCLSALLLPQESRYWQERLRSMKRSARPSPMPEHDRIGEENAFDLHVSFHEDARLCVNIADAITDPSERYDKVTASIGARAVIGRLFFEVGFCSGS